jgi:hypothetical protein
MDSSAALETLEAISASAAALAVGLRQRTDHPGQGGADPLREQADVFLDGLAEAARMEARMAALKVHLAAGYAITAAAMAPPAVSPQDNAAREMSVIAEVACALTISERSAGALLSEASTLTTVLPLTLAALQAGTVSWQHARVLCDETTGLEPSAVAALEAHFLDPDTPNPARGCPAGDLTPARFRAKARTWRERHHPVSLEARHRRSAADRRLEYIPDRDGMAWLYAYLPADTAAGIWDRTTTAARALQGPAEPRTLTQLRADVAAAWFLTPGNAVDGADGAPGGSGRVGDVPSPGAQVLVTVPVFSLLGLTGEPAVLDGYGPIPPSMARRLVADGASSVLRVLTDPRNGAPLEIGRASYRIPKALRQWLRLRDGRCPFPGCSNHSLDNDVDHLLAWSDGGGTGISNLGQPCRRHHRLKHATAWKPIGATRDNPPGWTSPTGRSYPSEQQDWEPPHWPDPVGEDRNWEPPDWPDLMDRPGSPAGSVGLGLSLPVDPLPVDSLPVDPLPGWALFTAA